MEIQRKKKLEAYLKEKGVAYEIIRHPETYTAQETAQAEHVSGKMQAKVVMVKADGKEVMAVLPANQRLDLKRLRHFLGAKEVRLMTEPEFERLFADCEVGAMPPFGNIYHLPLYVDGALAQNEHILFNAGTHRESIKMAFRDYEKLVRPALASFSVTPRETEETWPT